jgi:linoleoyl-CoA desaturase
VHRVAFNNRNKIFFNSINARVEKYFKESGQKKTGDNRLYFKSFILISVAAAIYILLVTVHLYPAISIVLCCLLGITKAGIGFNVMHDANHGSYSDKKWVNTTMGLSANLLGANAWLWKQKHNIIHHTYTNIDGVDDDIAKTPFLRACPAQRRLKVHRYQYIYCMPLYTLSSLMMISTDFIKYFRRKILTTQLSRMEMHEHFIFWASKIIYILLYIVLPSYLVGFIPALIGFALMHVMLGLTLSLVFQLAHVVESTHFAAAHQDGLQIENEWAVHQVQTTADFATNSKIISWFTGGLNFQVEHHLFPRISHVHYPAIHKFVKSDCQKFSIQFNDYPSMAAALLSHLRFLKRLGAG